MPRQTSLVGFSRRLNNLRKDLGRARINGEFGQRVVDREINKIAEKYKDAVAKATPTSEGQDPRLRKPSTVWNPGNYPPPGTLKKSWYVERLVAQRGRAGLARVAGIGDVAGQEGADVQVQVKNRDPRLTRAKGGYDLIDWLQFGTRTHSITSKSGGFLHFFAVGQQSGETEYFKLRRVQHRGSTKHVGFLDEANKQARKDLRNYAARLRRVLKQRGLFGRNR